jgi:hypothetical protein
MNSRSFFVSVVAWFLAGSSAGAYDMATIINRLSENSDKIDSYSASARVIYHI